MNSGVELGGEEEDASSPPLSGSSPGPSAAAPSPPAAEEPCVVSSEAEFPAAWAAFREGLGEGRLVGLDCEWVPNAEAAQRALLELCSEAGGATRWAVLAENVRRNRVALLQLASPAGPVLLLRLALFKSLPEPLKAFLADPTVLKAGVGIRGDAARLASDWDVGLAGALDLRFLARLAGETSGRLGLAGLAERCLGLAVEKNPKVIRSNWAAPTLSPAQLRYAALDARLGHRIADHFLHKLLPAGASSEDVRELVQPFLDRKFTKGAVAGASGRQSGGGRKKAYRTALLKDKLYKNVPLRAPDDEVLAFIGEPKARWYLAKGLGEAYQDGVRLLREPNGRPKGTELFYKHRKANRCVVCGSSEELLRKNVVPRQYRKFFPLEMKDHRSHDVLLLCLPCHERAVRADVATFHRLSEEYLAPCHKRPVPSEDRRVIQAKKIAQALLRQPHRIPQPRRDQMAAKARDLVKEACDVTEGMLKASWEWAEAEDVLERLDKLHIAPPAKDEETHAKIVTEAKASEPGGLPAFEQFWRRHFVDFMAPQFLPEGWSLDHNKERYPVLPPNSSPSPSKSSSPM